MNRTPTRNASTPTQGAGRSFIGVLLSALVTSGALYVNTRWGIVVPAEIQEALPITLLALFTGGFAAAGKAARNALPSTKRWAIKLIARFL